MSIKSNYYYLLKKGFALDELRNMERHEFDYYIMLYKEEIESQHSLQNQ